MVLPLEMAALYNSSGGTDILRIWTFPVVKAAEYDCVFSLMLKCAGCDLVDVPGTVLPLFLFA